MEPVVLIRVTLTAAPSTPTAPFLSQVGRFTTADHDIPSDEGTWVHGWVHSDSPIRYGSTADPSQGKGFFAEPIQGEITLVDDGISSAIEDGYYGVMGASVQFLIGQEDGGEIIGSPVTKADLRVVETEIQSGAIKLVLKDPSYTLNRPIFSVRSAVQIATDENDSSNPTQADYLKIDRVAQFAGMVFGNRPASIKLNQPGQAAKLARFVKTDLSQGDIISGGSAARKTSATANFFNQDPAYVDFWCVDAAEAERFYNECASCLAAGARVIVSDGSWFCDTETVEPGSAIGAISYGTDASGNHVVSIRLHSGTPNVNHVPADPIDPTQVSLFAVPSSVPVASQQCVLDGFARNKKTVVISGTSSFDGETQSFAPDLADSANYISIQPITDIGVAFVTGLANMVGGINYGDMGSEDGSRIYGQGSSDGIVTDPAKGPDPGGIARFGIHSDPSSTPTWVSLSAESTLRMIMSPTLAASDADFLFSDGSYVVGVTLNNLYGHSDDITLKVSPPFSAEDRDTYTHTFSSGETYSVAHNADTAPKSPIWANRVVSISDLGRRTPSVKIEGATIDTYATDIHMDLLSAFVWAVRKISFSSLYATVFPFWTRGDFGKIAAHGANILAGGFGFGTIQESGAIVWDAVSMPPLSGVYFNIRASAYFSGASQWLTIGASYDTSGLHYRPFLLSSADGVSWQTAFLGPMPSGTEPSEDFSAIVCTTSLILVGCSISSGGFGFRTGATAASLGAFTAFPSGVTFTRAPAITHDGTRWWFFGGAGECYYSADLATFHAVTSPFPTTYTKTAEFVTVGGTGYILASGRTGGSYAYATPSGAMAGSWFVDAIASAGMITSFCGTPLDVCAATATGEIFARADFTPSGEWVRVDNRVKSPGATPAYLAAGSVGGAGYWVSSNYNGESSQIVVSMQPRQSDVAVPPSWSPTASRTPEEAIWVIRQRFLGGFTSTKNPIMVGSEGRSFPTAFAAAFDPPSTDVNDYSGTTAIDAARKIAEEWRVFAGPMLKDPGTIIDGSSDNIPMDFAEIQSGNIQDVATLITAQYQPFGGEYLGHAYIQNVDKPYVSGQDSYYFAGWDADGENTNGLGIWNECRAAYLATGVLRSVSLTFDTVQDAPTLGNLFVAPHYTLGKKISNICRPTRYFKTVIDGNDSAASDLMPGNTYKPNATVFLGSGHSFGNMTDAGLVVEVDHNLSAGTHEITIAIPPI